MRETIRRMNALIEDMEPWLIALRRTVHQYPETGWLEMRTSAIIHERLSSLGYTVLTGSKAVSPEARMGVPDAETLSAHAKAVERQAGTPKRLPEQQKTAVRYDFASAGADRESFRFEVWRRYMRSALRQDIRLLSYGEPQGERDLREVLAQYLEKNRSVFDSGQ